MDIPYYPLKLDIDNPKAFVTSLNEDLRALSNLTTSGAGLPAGGEDNSILMFGDPDATGTNSTFWARPITPSYDPYGGSGAAPSDGRGFFLEYGQGMVGQKTLVVWQQIPVRLAMGGTEPADADVNDQSVSFWVNDNGDGTFDFNAKYNTGAGYVTGTLGTLT